MTLPALASVRLWVTDVTVPPVNCSVSPLVCPMPLNVNPPEGTGSPAEKSTISVSSPADPVTVRSVTDAKTSRNHSTPSCSRTTKSAPSTIT